MSASQHLHSTRAQLAEEQLFLQWLSVCAVMSERLGLRPYEYMFDPYVADEWRELFRAGLTPYEADMRVFRAVH